MINVKACRVDRHITRLRFLKLPIGAVVIFNSGRNDYYTFIGIKATNEVIALVQTNTFSIRHDFFPYRDNIKYFSYRNWKTMYEYNFSDESLNKIVENLSEHYQIDIISQFVKNPPFTSLEINFKEFNCERKVKICTI